MNIREILRLNEEVHTDAEVGIEIELEGDNLPPGNEVSGYWRREHDGSLRAQPDSAEFVLRRPLSRADGSRALRTLQEAFDRHGSTDVDSGRAGVHVHVNCQQMELHQLANFMCLYLVMEDLLVEYCGHDRVGNLFCLRAVDADFQVTMLQQAFEQRDLTLLNTDELRYASMNVRCLFQYGSVEFRAMRSTVDTSVIERWMDILLSLRDAAMEYEDPSHIMFAISSEGADDFCSRILGEHAEEVIGQGGCEFEVMQNMRNIQDIAYRVDWEDIKAPKKVIGGLEVPEDWDDDFPPLDL